MVESKIIEISIACNSGTLQIALGNLSSKKLHILSIKICFNVFKMKLLFKMHSQCKSDIRRCDALKIKWNEKLSSVLIIINVGEV